MKAGKGRWFAFAAFLAIIHGILFWIDHRPGFFLGDSASYIWSGISGNPPTDRSFVYGYIIRLIAKKTESLTSLLIFQAFLTGLICLISAYLLIRYFRVRPWIAFSTVILMTLEPLQLLYTRYVMTETMALFFFVFYIWVALRYLEDPKIRWLALLHVFAVLMICFRFMFIPLVWFFALAIPALAVPLIAGNAKTAAKKPFKAVVFHFVLSICFLFSFTTIYKQIHGSLQHKRPAFSYDSGFFMLGYVAPLLEPGDFADEDLGKRLLSNVSIPLADRRARPAQRWVDSGIVMQLEKLVPDRIKADRIASEAAYHAVIHKPFAFLRLGWLAFTDFFDREYLKSAMVTELGMNRLDDGFMNLLKTYFHYPWDAVSGRDLNTISGQYFLLSLRWIQLLLFLPLIWGLLFVVIRDADQRRKILIMAVSSLLFVGVALFMSERPVPRYLHMQAWLACMTAGVGLNRIMARLKPAPPPTNSP